MSISLLYFAVSTNRLYSGEKLAIGDRRWGRFNGAFPREIHTAESLLAEIRQGHSFCCVRRDDDCALDHCGERFCCPNQKHDVARRGRPVRYRKKSHFLSAEALAMAFGQGDCNSPIPGLMAHSFKAQYAAFPYSALGSTPEEPRSRVVSVLEARITDPDYYSKAHTALLKQVPQFVAGDAGALERFGYCHVPPDEGAWRSDD